MNIYRNLRYSSNTPCEDIQELESDIDAMREQGREIDSRVAILKEMRRRHPECEGTQ